jgi:ribonucleoside-diphosphate reductase beta chain
MASMDRSRAALRQMAREDPELAARVVLMTLPAAASRIPGPLTYDLSVQGHGTRRICVDGEGARVEVFGDEPPADGQVDFRLTTDPATLGEMAGGASPVKLMLNGRLRIRGKRRKALRLRAMSDAPLSMQDVLSGGTEVDPDVLYRSLRYLIDPAWTRGHRFVVCYEIELAEAANGAEPLRWYVEVRDGEPLAVTTEYPGRPPDAVARVAWDTYVRMVSGELTPARAMREQLTSIEGSVYPVTLLGRWIDRSQGRDDAELRREEEQRRVQQARAGSWGARANGAGPAGAPGQGDPGHEAEGERRARGDLLGYGQLYALWERQNWKAHEIDFSIDQEHWLTTPREAQENTAWSMGSFAVGEERVTADLAPFLLAAPSGEVEVFLATQLVDEARHAAFFDRFSSEVMALSADDFRGRMLELQSLMLPAWHEVFDDALRGVANRIKAAPDDLDLFVEGIATYHLVIEGVLAMTGQRFIIKYVEDHGLYPGFKQGFSLVEQDEHRHIAFGVRFLKEMVALDSRYGDIVEQTVAELVPRAAHVFVPPYAESAREFVSYGYRSAEIYGFAYRALKRRMSAIGLQVPSADELMPGPVSEPEEARAVGAPV